MRTYTHACARTHTHAHVRENTTMTNETTLNLNDFLKKIRTLQDDNVRLRECVRSYETHANELATISARLREIANELNPLGKTFNGDGSARHTRAKTRLNYNDIIGDLTNKLLGGMEVTARLIKSTYNANQNECEYIMTKLRQTNGSVKTRRNGQEVILYV